MESATEADAALRQQVIVADLGQQALETDDLDALMRDASAAIAETLNAEYCAVLELASDGETVLLRHGVGWDDGLVGTATAPIGPGSQAGYTLRSESPVTVDDLRTEERFSESELVTGHDVVSGISVVIGSVEEPWGVLGAHATERREFSNADAAFVKNVANVLASAIDRTTKERRLHERTRYLERYRSYTDDVFNAVDDVLYVLGEDGRLRRWNDSLCEVTGYSEAEVESMHALDFFDEGDTAAISDAIAECFETGSARVQADVLTSEGETVPYEFVGSALTDPEGNPVVAGIGRDVTDRRERTRELALYERLFETINDGIYVVDEDYRYTTVNEAFAELTGYARSELCGEHATRVVDEATLERAAELRAEMAVDDGANRTLETTIETADGDRVPVEVTFASLPTKDEEKRVGVVRDVTERKARERALTESERRYRTLVENFPNGAVGLFDEELEYIVAGGEALDDLGVPEENVVGSTLEERYPEDLVAEIEPYFRATFEGESNTFEYRAYDRDVWAHTLPVRNDDGEIFAGMIMVQDVTERKRIEREVRESERRFRRLAEHLDQVVWMTTADQQEVLYVNPAYKEVWGVDREDLYEDAAAWIERIHPDDRESVLEEFDRQPRDGYDAEYRIVRPDGEVRWIRDRATPIYDENGEVYRLVGDANDITERREYQRQLEESNERLEQFAYAASHDLQEPLRMVSSYLQLIDRRYGEAFDEDGEEFLAFAVDGADRMREMIDGLLEYSRVQTQGDEFEPVDLDAVLDDVRKNLQVKIAEHDAEIEAEPLPRVEGDDGQLRQVFQNLLSNAIEYSGDEPPRVRVSATRERSARDGPMWTVSVTDEGIGVDPADQERIFEIFQRLDGGGMHSGTGIGLALCERIVERHGGEIWVDSEPGEGATFSFTLPAV